MRGGATNAFLVFVVATYAAIPAMTADKSAVKPSVLSLPSGPGSIEGLGESFEPQLNTGTATYSVALQVPPGRVGFAPALSLVYNSGGASTEYGLGWRLSLPSLQRQTDKGLPHYTDWPVANGIDEDQDGEFDEFDEFDIIVHSNGEELVRTADGYFRMENEEEFTRFSRVNEGWSATQRNGTILSFGSSSNSRIQDATGRIFRWCLDEMEDTNGNKIVFQWQALDSTVQRYLEAIHYNPEDGTGMMISFAYEPRPDVLSDYRPRYHLVTAYRTREIQMAVAGQPVRTYRLDYAPWSVAQPLSLLSEMTQIGRDGVSSLPPATFNYVPFQGEAAVPQPMSDAPSLPLTGVDGESIDLIDVNTDGLPDLLDTRWSTFQPHSYYLNLGPDAEGNVQWTSTRFMDTVRIQTLASPSVWLADMDGNGTTELFDHFGSDTQLFRLTGDGILSLDWESAGLLSQASFVFPDPSGNTRLLDADNDKRTDVMQSTGGVYSTWLNLESGVWSAPFSRPSPVPGLTLNRTDVHLADMNGDRLQDLVELRSSVCIYYPNRGLADFGPAVTMGNAPVQIVDESHLMLADVNGDGRADILYEFGGAVKVWINLGLSVGEEQAGMLAAPFTVSGAFSDSTTTFRQADLNGNGSKDLVWNTYPNGGPYTWMVLDFAPEEQPYQLKTITNGIGATTTLSYSTTTQEMRRDALAGRPWTKGVPFPVPVVSRVEVSDGLQPLDNVRVYEYHDGFYDGDEKEFRGFAGTVLSRMGDEVSGSPTLNLSHQFHTGEGNQALKGRLLVQEAKTTAGELFYRDTTQWDTRLLAQGVPSDPRDVVFPYPYSRQRDVIEKGTSPVRLEWEFEYDDYGTIVSMIAFHFDLV